MSDSLCLAKLCAHPEIGVNDVKAMLNLLVTDAVLFFEVGKFAGRDQVIKTVELILEDYHHFKPEDFKLCFNRAMKGYYGTIYDRVDGAVILEWLMKYDNERDLEVESLQAKQNKQLKQLSAALIEQRDVPDEVFERNMAKLKETLAANKIARETAKQAEKPVPNEMWVKSQDWMKQFEMIRKQQGYPKNRLIQRYGLVYNPFYNPDKPQKGVFKMIPRMMDINQYLEHKHWQWLTFSNPAVRDEYRDKLLKK